MASQKIVVKRELPGCPMYARPWVPEKRDALQNNNHGKQLLNATGDKLSESLSMQRIVRYRSTWVKSGSHSFGSYL